jgi:uncharacterized protein YbjQ (UPF0145 family)
MSDRSKIQAGHLGRIAYVYVRQSTPHQLEHNRESTQRQYALVERAAALGANAVVGVDLDYEVLGQNNSMLMVTASGTAVVVE